MAIHPTEHDISEPRKATGVDQATLFDMPSQSEGGPTDALSESTESVVVPDTPAQLVEDNNNLLAETSSPVAPLADTTRTSRVSFLGNVLNTRAKQATAAGLAVAALGGGIWAANRGEDSPNVHASTPIATSTPNTPSATETATTQPAPSTSQATPTTEAPASKVPVPTAIETPSVAPGEVATEVVLPVSYFREVMKDQSKTLAELSEDFPGLEEKTSADTMMLKAIEAGVTARSIGAYQEYFNKCYDNPVIRRLLGDPNGSMSPSQLADYDSADNIAGLVPATNDSYLNAIAAAIKNNDPGASKTLLKLTSINPALVRGNQEKIESGVDRFYVSPSSFIVNAVPFKTADRANATLLASLNYQENGKKALQLSVLIPVDNPNANIDPDSLVAVPYSIQYSN